MKRRAWFCLIFLLCCTPPKSTKEIEFEEIVEGIPILELPCEFPIPRGKEVVAEIKSAKTLAFNDSLFRMKSIGVWARVFPEEPIYYLVGTMPTDQGTPFLMSFERNGRLIDSAPLLGTFYGAGPSGISDNYAMLYPDMRFIIIDSLYNWQVNEEDTDIIPGTGIGVTLIKQYKIDKTGNVELLSTDSTQFEVIDP